VILTSPGDVARGLLRAACMALALRKIGRLRKDLPSAGTDLTASSFVAGGFPH
jgi:hypothetical protein